MKNINLDYPLNIQVLYQTFYFINYVQWNKLKSSEGQTEDNNWRVKSVSVLCEYCPIFMKKCENCAIPQSSLTSIKKNSVKGVR